MNIMSGNRQGTIGYVYMIHGAKTAAFLSMTCWARESQLGCHFHGTSLNIIKRYSY